MDGKKLLTVGMATYDDFDGVYFSIQSLRLHHPEVADSIEFVVVDNNPNSEQGQAVAEFVTNYVPHSQYVPCTEKVSTSTRNKLFEAARTPYMLAMDCHVLLENGALARLLKYYQEQPHTPDLLHGPLLHDTLINDKIATHMEPEWNDQMFGTWATDPRGLERDSHPFDIPMHGLGLFSCRTDEWLGFHDRFRGFGGEEGYIHEKYRRDGRRVLCLPFLRWMHRFIRPDGPPYPLKLHERVHNYLVGWLDLDWDPAEVIDHFEQFGGRGRWEDLLERIQDVEAAPVGEPSQSSSTKDSSHAPKRDATTVGERSSTPAGSLLWTDTELFDARYEKSARALVAVQQTLARHLPLEGREQEFLDIYARVAASDPEAFTEVWSSPVAYFWTRIAYQLVKCCIASEPVPPITQQYVSAIGAKSPHEALVWHLDQFKMFALSLAIVQRADSQFESPWEPRLPVAIPNTPWSISGDGPISVHGIEQGRLCISDGSGTHNVPLEEATEFASTQTTRHWCPTIVYKGCRLFAQPHAFHIPGLAETDDVLQAGMEFQHEQRDVIRETLATIEQYDPATFAQFRDVMSLVALKRPESASTSNTSYSRLPGALTATATKNALTLAEDFIHEFYHNRLFFIEEQGAFFEGDNGRSITQNEFYSPWRCDPRPVYGVWHAVYVFTAVCRYWLSVYQNPPGDVTAREYATERLIRIPQQLAMASHVLTHHAKFSAFGRSLFDELVDEAAHLREEIDAAGVAFDAPALDANPDGTYSQQRSEIDERPLSVRESLREHCQLYDIDAQCEELADAMLERA